jgi:hypothetical protein
MSTGLLTVVMLWIGAAASVVISLVYGIGSRWWTTLWGRSNFLLHAVLNLVYLRSGISVLNHRVAVSVPWDTWVITTAMTVALVVYCATTIVVTARGRAQRRAEREKKQ